MRDEVGPWMWLFGEVRFVLSERLSRVRRAWIAWHEGEEEAAWYGLARQLALCPIPGLAGYVYWDRTKRRWNVSEWNRQIIREGMHRAGDVIRAASISSAEAASRINAVFRAMDPKATEDAG